MLEPQSINLEQVSSEVETLTYIDTNELKDKLRTVAVQKYLIETIQLTIK